MGWWGGGGGGVCVGGGGLSHGSITGLVKSVLFVLKTRPLSQPALATAVCECVCLCVCVCVCVCSYLTLRDTACREPLSQVFLCAIAASRETRGSLWAVRAPCDLGSDSGTKCL